MKIIFDLYKKKLYLPDIKLKSLFILNFNLWQAKSTYY